ncbi:hypothetical protein [Sphingomonas bacterium]|uniref:hypothetical protein n=1 Tax=Sphingomonas bacterium TaxID=1895847 RepID=UPI0020C61090|nr:hypothetical protein [Sphingomonas bacterium]
MSAVAAAPGATDATPPDLAGLQPLPTLKSRWPLVVGIVFTVAMLVGLGYQLWTAGLPALARSVPGSPLFYVAFVVLYAVPPLFDYAIFHRLWGIPVAGLVALTKKRIANDVLFGYSGEAYFYAWARGRAKMVAAPFGAVKDVSILSALSGHAMTLGLIGLVVPFGHAFLKPEWFHGILAVGVVSVAMSLPFLVFSRRVFSLDRAQLWRIFWLHCGRILAGWLMTGLVWHFALPAVAVAMWLLLVAVKQIVSRLPFVPNKDLLFANLAALLIGHATPISRLVTMVSVGTLLVHLILVVGFGLHHLFSRKPVLRSPA